MNGDTELIGFLFKRPLESLHCIPAVTYAVGRGRLVPNENLAHYASLHSAEGTKGYLKKILIGSTLTLVLK